MSWMARALEQTVARQGEGRISSCSKTAALNCPAGGAGSAEVGNIKNNNNNISPALGQTGTDWVGVGGREGGREEVQDKTVLVNC